MRQLAVSQILEYRIRLVRRAPLPARRHGGFTYLDASCLIFGRRRGAAPSAPMERLDVVDFRSTRSRDGRGEHMGVEL